MPRFQIRERLIPYKLLVYLLYGSSEDLGWITQKDEGVVRLHTGPATRQLRIKNKQLWEALDWLSDQELIAGYRKGTKRGTAIITLVLPVNLQPKKDNILI